MRSPKPNREEEKKESKKSRRTTALDGSRSDTDSASVNALSPHGRSFGLGLGLVASAIFGRARLLSREDSLSVRAAKNPHG